MVVVVVAGGGGGGGGAGSGKRGAGSGARKYTAVRHRMAVGRVGFSGRCSVRKARAHLHQVKPLAFGVPLDDGVEDEVAKLLVVLGMLLVS